MKAMFTRLAALSLACALAGCGESASDADFHAAYAEIVAEEDARGEIGLARVHAHLAGENAELRALAVRALGRLEDPDQLDRIDEMLEDPDPAVRAATAAAMAQAVFGTDPGPVIGVLAARIDREADLQALGGLATGIGRLTLRAAAERDQADAALVAAANRLPAIGDDPGLVARMGLARGIEAFARSGSTVPGGPPRPLTPELATVAAELSALRGSADGIADADTRDELAAARIRRLAVAALTHGDQLGPEAARARLQDEDWGVRRQVIVAASRHGTEAEHAIAAGLADADPRVRVEALAAYDRHLRPGRGCAAIIGAIADPDPHVAATAIGLAARPCPDLDAQRQALRARIAELDDPEADWRAAARAVHALAAIAPGDAGDATARLAQHPNPFARAWAARAAAEVADEAALVELASDPIANVREAALRGLGAVAGAGAADVYLAQLEADDPQLVMTATRLLVEHAATTTAAEPLDDLLAALARFTARQRETERDVRVALLDGIGAVGGYASDDLAPYLADYDPAVADRAAALLAEATGATHEAAPQPLPRTPTPDADRLRELERSAVVLRMAGLGDIVIALRPDLAATNADRFARLAATGQLDGLTFHRVEPNFVIQGGSPNANEYSGDGPFSRDETSRHPHWRGTVGLSTRGRDTGDGQIFVNLADNPRLDFNYTIHGVVVEGMEVVDAVQEGAVIESAEVVPRDATHHLARRVEIHRTEYGIPHILADDLEAMGFALGYVQSEDYSASIAVGMTASRGIMARHLGTDELDADFVARETHARAVATFHQLDPRARQVYRGFAEGVNQYIRLHPDEFPAWIAPDFTGVDALARDVQTWSRSDAARFVARLATDRTPRDADPPAPEAAASLLDGSNAWAFHSSRTESGRTILLRNPHLRWDGDHDLLDRPSGLTYYEAHVRVPGVIDFYGDFRIGTAFGIIGGFNPHLGWATTNNYPTLSQVYRLDAHPTLADHAVLDGRPLPLTRRDATVDHRTPGGGTAIARRFSWRTPHGPVIHRTDEHVYLLKDPRDGEFRRGEQFLRMMMAGSLDEWLAVMRMRAHPTSNFTYADRAGNIAHYYNARLPLLPHPVTGDTAAHATSAADIWSELVPWEDLPLYLNPPGGYVQQANDPPDYTNLGVPMDRDTVPPNLPVPRLRLRSQLSLDLAADRGERLSLEGVMRMKHSPRVPMAERTVEELVAAAGEDAVLREAATVLAAWDRTAASESRGGVLFQRWAGEYFGGAPDSLRWREVWDPERPTETPFGLADPAAAREALGTAAASLARDGIALDAAWGDVHRVVRGGVDAPVSGCPPTLGCFRTLSYETLEDGRRAANRGDAWVLLVEFGDVPTAYTVLAYGQTARTDSPHFADQAAMFARGELKPVAWTPEDIQRATIRRYRPGEATNAQTYRSQSSGSRSRGPISRSAGASGFGVNLLIQPPL